LEFSEGSKKFREKKSEVLQAKKTIEQSEFSEERKQ